MTKSGPGESTTATIGDLRGLLTLSRAETGKGSSRVPLRSNSLENSDTHALRSGSGGPNHESGKGQGPNPVPTLVRIMFGPGTLSRYPVMMKPIKCILFNPGTKIAFLWRYFDVNHADRILRH